MADIYELINKFEQIANNPRKVMEKYLAEGKKIIGCFPEYTPQPLVTALDMIPMGLWGGQITPTVAGKYNPIFTCSILRSCLEYGMTDVYKGLSSAMMPILCDTLRGTSSSWRAGVKDISLISFIHPQNRTDSSALEFMIEEYKSVQEKLEKIAGCKITNAKLNDTLDLYNEKNAIMKEFTNLANEHLDLINPIVRHNIMKSATFLDIKETISMVKELICELKSLPVYEWTGKKVILTGITAEPQEFLKIFVENNVAVVGDDLAQESRQYRTDYPYRSSAIERLAAQWFDIKGCSLVHDVNNYARGQMLVKKAKENGADCIAICLMKFCDIEEYDYPYLTKMAEDEGLYSLNLEIDQSTQDNGQSRTKIQSYAEI